MGKKQSKKRKQVAKRVSTKGLNKYLRRILRHGSVEITVLRELVLTRYFRDEDRAIKKFLEIVEQAVKSHVTDSLSAGFVVSSSSGVMRLGLHYSAEKSDLSAALDPLPSNLVPAEASRDFSQGSVSCEKVCKWMVTQLSKSRYLRVADVHRYFDNHMKSAHATIALGCIATCPDIEIVDVKGTPCYTLDQ